MENRLKKERNRLFLRITLILLAAWIIVSAVVCVVRLNIEKTNSRNNEFTRIYDNKQMLVDRYKGYYQARQALIDIVNYPLEENEKDALNSQLVIISNKTYENVVDTSKAMCVDFSLKQEDSNSEIIGFIKYDAVKNALSGKEYKRIQDYLNTKRDDGNYYELVCTKLQIENLYFVPVELKIVLADAADPRFIVDDNVEKYELKSNIKKGGYIYESGSVVRNVIPKSYFKFGKLTKDYIAPLAKSQPKKSVDMIRTGPAEYLFYAYFPNEYLENLIDYDYTYNKELSENIGLKLIYAKRINILENCKSDLFFSVVMIFVYFLSIALLFCFMIWKTVKAQIIQEQKRMDLTNALAHDIKTPLFVISGYAYSMQEGIDGDEKDEYLNKILQRTEEIDSLVHKMIDFSKLDSYSMKLSRSEFDLYELIESVVKEHKSLPDGKEIKLSGSGESFINADKALVKQAVENLIDNAVSYSPESSVIEINVSKNSFEISNSCDNLTKADIKNLTRPYFRKDKSRHKTGNGLGLSIVNSIFELHKAKFTVKLKNNIITFKAVF